MAPLWDVLLILSFVAAFWIQGRAHADLRRRQRRLERWSRLLLRRSIALDQMSTDMRVMKSEIDAAMVEYRALRDAHKGRLS